MGEKREKRRFRLTGPDRVIAVVLAILAAASLVISALRPLGLSLIHGELYTILPLSIPVVAAGWGAYALFRRIKSRLVRLIAGVLTSVLLFMAVMVGLSYLSLVISLTVPQKYATVRTEDGAHRLVVMRLLDADEGRIELRRAARLAANPEADSEVAIEDWGYVYTAYAPVGGLFYRPDTLVEGEVHIGYVSGAELMLNWEDDGATGYFFVRDPEPGDGGEMWAKSR